MRLLQTLLIFSLIASNAALANSLDSAIVLKKGDITPYDGVLLSNSQAKVIYGELKQFDNLKLINESLNKEVTLHEANETEFQKQIIELKSQNTDLSTNLEKASSDNFWRETLFFGLGVLSTGLIVYAVKRNW